MALCHTHVRAGIRVATCSRRRAARASAGAADLYPAGGTVRDHEWVQLPRSPLIVSVSWRNGVERVQQGFLFGRNPNGKYLTANIALDGRLAVRALSLTTMRCSLGHGAIILKMLTESRVIHPSSSCRTRPSPAMKFGRPVRSGIRVAASNPRR